MMNLKETARILGVRIIDLEIQDLSNLVLLGGHEPIQGSFTLRDKSYYWKNFTEPKDLGEEMTDDNDDGGYKVMSPRIAYKIKDEKGNFTDKYAFVKEPQGRGRKPKWWYSSYTGYVSGAILYPDSTGSIMEVIHYLELMI